MIGSGLHRVNALLAMLSLNKSRLQGSPHHVLMAMQHGMLTALT